MSAGEPRRFCVKFCHLIKNLLCDFGLANFMIHEPRKCTKAHRASSFTWQCTVPDVRRWPLCRVDRKPGARACIRSQRLFCCCADEDATKVDHCQGGWPGTTRTIGLGGRRRRHCSCVQKDGALQCARSNGVMALGDTSDLWLRARARGGLSVCVVCSMHVCVLPWATARRGPRPAVGLHMGASATRGTLQAQAGRQEGGVGKGAFGVGRGPFVWLFW